MPRHLQRLILRHRDVAIGAGGVRRIGERESGIGEGIVRVRGRIRSVGERRRRQVGLGDEFEQDFIPAKDASAAPVVEDLPLGVGNLGLRLFDGGNFGLVRGVGHGGRSGHGDLRRRLSTIMRHVPAVASLAADAG